MASETVKCCREWEQTVDLFDHSVIRYTDEAGGHATLPLDDGPVHCTWCGARFTLLEDGAVDVGPSQEKLLEVLRRAIGECVGWECPADMDYQCVGNPDGQADGPEHADCTGIPEVCWMTYCGMGYDEAAELWRRMEEAAK